MEKEIKLLTYTKDKTIVQSASGISAVLQLLSLLWNNTVRNGKHTIKTQDKSITIKENDFTYVFENVPIQWDGSIDTSLLHQQIYKQMKGGE